jgi:ATP-dependent Clp protease ATP-binding subunit ClpC
MTTFHRYTLQSSEKVIEALNIGMMEMVNQKKNIFYPEYLLLGLLEQPESILTKIFKTLNKDEVATREAIMDEIYSVVAPSDEIKLDKPEPIKVNISREVEAIFDSARNISNEFQDKYISTGTLFLAFFSEKTGGARGILLRSGLSLPECRRALQEIRGAKKINEKNAESKETALNLYTTNLTELARAGKLDPVIGREVEINRIIQVLSRRKKNNPVLIGPPGVGKTVIVEGLAEKIADADVPEILLNKEVMLLDMTEVVAGAKFKGEFEERLKQIKDEIINAKGSIILFIDEIHTIATGSPGSDSISASNILKPALARGQLQCIGATTLEEYKKYIEKDKALERRFQSVIVSEPSEVETLKILKGLKDHYERHHQVVYSPEALETAAKFSKRYISGRFLPDKAIDLIDEAGSEKHLQLIYIPPEIRTLKKEKERLLLVKNDAFYSQKYEEVAELQQQIVTLESKLDSETQKWRSTVQQMDNLVTEHDIAEVLSRWTSIPVTRITQSEKERLIAMEQNIHKRLIGQTEAVKSVSNAIRRNRAGLKRKDTPIGTFLFLGPTGVGKTELAKSLAEFLFDDESKLVRLDMSEYMERHTVSRIIGSPPGYVGYGEGGQLTEIVRRNPYSVVLLDEIEKAHPDVFNILLQIFDNGRITDSQGLTVDFRNTIIIGTSNIGSDILQKEVKNIGFSKMETAENYENTRKEVFDRLKKVFKPEFLNRIDDTIIFHKLTKEHIVKILDLEIEKLKRSLAEQKFNISISDTAKKFLVEVGFSETYGARPLQREIASRVETKISQMIIKGKATPGSCIFIRKHARKDCLQVVVKPPIG